MVVVLQDSAGIAGHSASWQRRPFQTVSLPMSTAQYTPVEIVQDLFQKTRLVHFHEIPKGVKGILNGTVDYSRMRCRVPLIGMGAIIIGIAIAVVA
jgi:hypothetical protein